MSQILDHGQFDPNRVAEFLDDFMNPTGHFSGDLEKRTQELDRRINSATLSIADKVEVFKKLAPRAEDNPLEAKTDRRKELRMERLLLSVAPEDLPLFKFALEYDGDYKDLEEYIFHDIDKKKCQDRIIEHFGKTPQRIGIKVLSDVDDTMYANLIDERYPKKTLYPGVLEFYDSLKREPFELRAIPVTTLSARPNPIAGILEETSLKSLVAFTKERLCPSALSGALVSSTTGTIETLVREDLDRLSDEIPHGEEDKIGQVKFENFSRFSSVYPEYRYVFVGDSGQADALTAQLMVTEGSTEGTSRVVTTFIHDLRQSEDDAKSASPIFRNLRLDVLIRKTSSTGRGVIVFRNYIDAAVVAHMHSATLENLVTAEGLARITKAALKEFQEIDFQGKTTSGRGLRQQYRQDADEACKLLTMSPSGSSALQEDVAEIRRILDEGF
jgi:hypothetical protein